MPIRCPTINDYNSKMAYSVPSSYFNSPVLQKWSVISLNASPLQLANRNLVVKCRFVKCPWGLNERPYFPSSFDSDLRPHFPFSTGKSAFPGQPCNVLWTLYFESAILMPHHAQVCRTTYLRNACHLNPLLGMAIESGIAHISPQIAQ